MPQPDKVSSIVWPDMKTVIMSCLCYEPEERPNAEQVWEALRKPEVHCLKRNIPVSQSTTVECLCVEVSNKKIRDTSHKEFNDNCQFFLCSSLFVVHILTALHSKHT